MVWVCNVPYQFVYLNDQPLVSNTVSVETGTWRRKQVGGGGKAGLEVSSPVFRLLLPDPPSGNLTY